MVVVPGIVVMPLAGVVVATQVVVAARWGWRLGLAALCSIPLSLTLLWLAASSFELVNAGPSSDLFRSVFGDGLVAVIRLTALWLPIGLMSLTIGLVYKAVRLRMANGLTQRN